MTMEGTLMCEDCSRVEGVAPLRCGKKHCVCATCLVQRTLQIKDPREVLRCDRCEQVETNTTCNLSTTPRLEDKPGGENGDQARPLSVATKATGDSDSRKAVAEGPPCSQVQGTHKNVPDLPGIHIFVDDSNIWIEAKKLHAKKFNTFSEDPRVRIDMGKLADVLANGRPVQEGILYGSEPPPIDTVWKKIEERAGWKVKSKRRDMITGKEKQIDTNLVADVTATAIRTPIHERTAIVLVTGDANVLPAVEKVLEEKQWNVEVYMWKDALSKQIIYYGAEHHRRVKVIPLDSYLDHLAFTNMRFSVSNRDYLIRTVSAYGVVFSMKPNAFKRRVPTKQWFQRLENIAQWPCRYYWFERKSGEQSDDLVIVFPPYSETREFNVAKFLQNIKVDRDSNSREYRLPLVLKAQAFRQFMDKEKEQKNVDSPVKLLDAVLEEICLLNRSDLDPGYENYAVCMSEESDDSEWTVVKRRYQPRRQKFSDPCRYGMHCTCGTQCPFKHSDEDKEYFKKRGGTGNPYRKVKLCKYFETKRCWRSKEDCDGAHGEDDAHCLACGEGGHFTDNCTNLKFNAC